ncbi:hypothetical protein B0J12DRAFT_642513 [Macrophomina phaseolina]|uniref:Uncharacterized protein n=1 Tax=Macrophomina phaseolina TaxID=35725 RepID=A0ABQ8GVD9_9PEZI|nr:hypothetical protein B0J12DRAFT_642513 [Macrophomina phaseolina]
MKCRAHCVRFPVCSSWSVRSFFRQRSCGTGQTALLDQPLPAAAPPLDGDLLILQLLGNHLAHLGLDVVEQRAQGVLPRLARLAAAEDQGACVMGKGDQVGKGLLHDKLGAVELLGGEDLEHLVVLVQQAGVGQHLGAEGGDGALVGVRMGHGGRCRGGIELRVKLRCSGPWLPGAPRNVRRQSSRIGAGDPRGRSRGGFERGAEAVGRL